MQKQTNIVFEACTEVVEQLKLVRKCNDSELDVEAKRAEAVAKLAVPIAAMAKAQVDMYIHTGTLPENNLLFSGQEKIVTNSLKPTKPIKAGKLLMEEFNR